MRYRVDQCNRVVANHGLGDHYAAPVGQMPFRPAQMYAPPPACPPPGYPQHTQESGTSCCLPGGCVPPAGDTLEAKIDVNCVVSDASDPLGEKSVGMAQCPQRRGKKLTDSQKDRCCRKAFPKSRASMFGL